jgi:hypothetical protein
MLSEVVVDRLNFFPFKSDDHLEKNDTKTLYIGYSVSWLVVGDFRGAVSWSHAVYHAHGCASGGVGEIQGQTKVGEEDFATVYQYVAGLDGLMTHIVLM